VTAPSPRNATDRPLSASRILHFHLPLVLNGLLMACVGPVVNVALGRSAEPRLDLAAFWLAFTIVFFAQSFSHVVQQVTVMLAGRRESLRGMGVTASLAGAAATLLVLVIAGSPFGAWVFRDVIPTSPRASELARHLLVLLAPIPILLAVRGIANGVAIAHHRTRLLAMAMGVRVVVLAAVSACLLLTVPVSGAAAAALALLAGVTLDTLFIVAATLPLRNAAGMAARGDESPAVRPSFARIVAPLAVATLVWSSTRFVMSAVLGRLPDPELAQAGFGVVLPILLVSCAPLWTMLEVSLVLPRSRADLASVLSFAAVAAGLTSLAIGVIAFTPLREVVLRRGFHLSPELERLVSPALALLVVEPFALSARAVAQGLLMRARRTQVLLVLSPVKLVLTIALGLLVATRAAHVNGVLLAMSLVIGGDLLDALVLGRAAVRACAGADVFAGPIVRADDDEAADVLADAPEFGRAA